MMKRILFALAAAAAAVLLMAWISIELGVRRIADAAVKQYRGERVDALLAALSSEEWPLPDRNRAVWALGQLRDRRALATLRRMHTGAACDHDRAVCQYELRKAIAAIERRHPVWLGYRGAL